MPLYNYPDAPKKTKEDKPLIENLFEISKELRNVSDYRKKDAPRVSFGLDQIEVFDKYSNCKRIISELDIKDLGKLAPYKKSRTETYYREDADYLEKLAPVAMTLTKLF
jgi:hypothetical protein